jgi:hypothetical protein
MSNRVIIVPRKLSKTNLALVFFTLVLVLSVCGLVEMQSIYHPSYAVYADKLGEKPSNYFVLENPDRYIIEAISSQSYVYIGSPEDTQIDELITAHGISNVEYNSTYYQVGFLFGDNFPPAYLPLMLLAGILISASSIAVIASLKATNYMRNRHGKES